MPLDEQQVQRALGQLMSELSPEIRTPNTVIMGLSELMLVDKTNSLNNKQRALLNTIHQNSVKLQVIAEQHGGEMEVRNTESQLEVILALPISKNRPDSNE